MLSECLSRPISGRNAVDASSVEWGGLGGMTRNSNCRKSAYRAPSEGRRNCPRRSQTLRPSALRGTWRASLPSPQRCRPRLLVRNNRRLPVATRKVPMAGDEKRPRIPSLPFIPSIAGPRVVSARDYVRAALRIRVTFCGDEPKNSPSPHRVAETSEKTSPVAAKEGKRRQALDGAETGGEPRRDSGSLGAVKKGIGGDATVTSRRGRSRAAFPQNGVGYRSYR